ncbi:MAG TPA: hypothetical protein VFN75_05145 [Pseudonocardiaceae bacterium]|nr:hypothetical protein [Pseudonocardiaceae bacterium]
MPIPKNAIDEGKPDRWDKTIGVNDGRQQGAAIALYGIDRRRSLISRDLP